MEVFRPLELSKVEEIKILHNVRLVGRHDLNHFYSKDNLHVQFDIAGDLKGLITCHLCLDNLELSTGDKNYIFPLFIETMNILIGKQVSMNGEGSAKVKISPPKLSMIPKEINTAYKASTQKYELELESISFVILVDSNLEALN